MQRTQLNKLAITEIFEKFILQRLDGRGKDNLYDGDIERVTHGVLHAARVAGLVIVLTNMLRKCESADVNLLTRQDIMCLIVTAWFHDAARKGENRDTWEAESRDLCQQFLESIGISQAHAYYYSSLITLKESKRTTDPKLTIMRKILQSADCLDVMRCVKKFDVTKVSLSDNFVLLHNGAESFMKLMLSHAMMIASQQDLQEDLEIVLGETVVANFAATLSDKYRLQLNPGATPKDIVHSIDIKKQLEHSRTALEDIFKQFSQHKFIGAYFHDALDYLNADVSYNKTEYQLLRQLTRNSAPHCHLKNDFAIKALRDGEFFQEYLDGLLSGAPPHALRNQDKKAYIVNGEGVMARETKAPQYTVEEKRGFTKKQAVSIGTPSWHVPVFNFGSQYQHLVGMIFTDMRHVLLSNYLDLFDAGSTGRINEFSTPFEAEAMASRNVNRRIFSKANFTHFKRAIENPKTYATRNFKYNECQVRLRFVADNSCQLFIGRDTLESRLIAACQARILKQRLLAKGMCDNSFEVSIIYYLPNTPDIHTRVYSIEEQALDRTIANEYLKDSHTRRVILESYHYSLLLALNKSDLHALLDNKLCIRVLAYNPHIYFYLQELRLLPNDNLDSVMEAAAQRLDLSNESDEALSELMDFMIMPKTFMSHNHKVAFDAVMRVIGNNPDLLQRTKILFKDYMEVTWMLGALSHPDDMHYLDKLLEIGCRLDCVDTDGVTLLMGAAKHANAKGVRVLLERGCDVNAVDQKGKSALHYAATQNESDVLLTLLGARQIKCDIKDKKGKTPLVYCIERDLIKHTLAILEVAPDLFDLNSLNDKGESILMLAAQRSVRFATIQIFQANMKEFKLDINHQDDAGNTLLHVIIANPMIPMDAKIMVLKIFLGDNPDLSIANKAGLTPAKLAHAINSELGALFQALVNSLSSNQTAPRLK